MEFSYNGVQNQANAPNHISSCGGYLFFRTNNRAIHVLKDVDIPFNTQNLAGGAGNSVRTEDGTLKNYNGDLLLYCTNGTTHYLCKTDGNNVEIEIETGIQVSLFLSF